MLPVCKENVFEDNTNTLFKGVAPGVFGAIGSQCDYNLAEIPKTKFRDQFS